MNSLERIKTAVGFGEPDRLPVVAQVFGHAAAVANVPLRQYVQDGELLARCQLKALEHYCYDAVFGFMDVNVETEALGSVLKYHEHLYPTVKTYALTARSDFQALKAADLCNQGRIPQLLKALNILRSELKDEVLVAGCVMGPWTLAMQLLGAEGALYLAVDAPHRLEELLDLCTEVVIDYGKAQLTAGAHLAVVFDPSASPAVVPASFFREREIPRLTRVFAALQDAGSLANWLHIAGPVQPILPYYDQAGVNLANFDYCVSSEQAQQALPNTCLDGNVRPLSFVCGTPDEIAQSASQLINSFASRKGYILSSGCEIPPGARYDNVSALVNVLSAGS